MLSFVILIVPIILGLVLRVRARDEGPVKGEDHDDVWRRESANQNKQAMRWGGVAMVVVGVFGLIFTSITRVPDGHVSAVSTFGVFDDTTLQPGLNLIAPWQSTVEIDGRLQCRKFGEPSETETNPFSTEVTAQARGGGNLTIDMSVCTQADPESAVELLRQVGPNFSDVLLTTSPRSCLRDAAKNFTVDENIGERRTALSEQTLTCTNEFTEPRGLNVIEVLISDVDPGAAVKAAIDEKEQAEKELQLAETNLRQARIDAEALAAEALGISNAEQIVACGAVERTVEVDGEARISVVPNDTCEDQFSSEYLQWLYINQLSEIDGVVVLPPELDENLFITIPPASSATGVAE